MLIIGQVSEPELLGNLFYLQAKYAVLYKQNMVISLIFGLLKVHSSTNKYFYEKRMIYIKSAHSNYGKKNFFSKKI
jgi:hypothetical protein